MIIIHKASAGSGKTYSLAREYIKYMLGHKDETSGRYRLNRSASGSHRRVLAMTFTNKATEEMKSRIVHELAVLAGMEKGWSGKSSYESDLCKDFGCTPEELSRAAGEALKGLLYDFGHFNISTIDSFFQTVLRSFAHEAEVSGNYALELDDEEVIRMSIDELLQSLNNSRPSVETRRIEAWLTRYMRSLVEDGKHFALFNRDSDLHESLVKFVSKVNNDTFRENEDLIMDYLRESDLFVTFCKKVDEITRASSAPTGLLSQAESLLSTLTDLPPKSVSHHFLAFLEKFIANGWKSVEKGCGNTIVNISQDGDKMWTASVIKNNRQDNVISTAAKDFALNFIDAYQLRVTLKVIRDNLYQMGLLSAIMKLIDNFRVENSTLLLSDTNSLLSKVIGNEDSPFLYEKLGTRFNHYLIDEFQDTSVSQWNNMKLLLKESLAYGHDNLVIGDEKQCIYRFRNSDPTLLQNLHAEPWVGDESISRGGATGENTNWRSSVEVIRFNNSLFSSIARLYGVTDVYANVVQAIPEKHLDHHGYVKVSLIDDDDQRALENMATEMRRQLSTGGYRPSDIAVLVRDGSDGKKVFDYLEDLKKHDDTFPQIDIISDRSLLISGSNAVAAVISRLRLLAMIEMAPTAERRSVREITMVLDEFDRRDHSLSPEEALDHAIAKVLSATRENSSSSNQTSGDTQATEEMTGVIGQETGSTDDRLHSVDLMSLIENIIDTALDDDLRARDNIFITSFVDLVTDYLSQGHGDIMSFLEWWDDTGSSRSIPGGENTRAITLLTMHKSKGLEFPCVHVPFAGKNSRGGSDIEWFEKVPLSGIDAETVPPLIPLKVSSSLINTPFRERYEEIIRERVLDITNLLYVTMTRAVDELIVSVGINKSVSQGKTTDSPSAIIYNGLKAATGTDNGLINLDPGDNDTVEVGRPTVRREEEVKKVSAMKASVTADAPVYSLSRNNAVWGNTRVDKDRLNSIEVARERGLMIHQILSFVHTPEDIPAAIDLFAASDEGHSLRDDELEELRKIVETRVKAVGARPWFEGFSKAYREREIILSTDDKISRSKNSAGDKTLVRRVDRVVWTGSGEVHIVDYKTGSQKPSRYERQLREYMNCFRSMTDLPVRGFLYYLDSGDIIEV